MSGDYLVGNADLDHGRWRTSCGRASAVASMSTFNLNWRRLKSVQGGALAYLFIFLSLFTAHGQASPEDLLAYFAATDLGEEIGLYSCGLDRFATAEQNVKRLIESGPRALPLLEDAVAELEVKRERSKYFPRAGWVFRAYAVVAGRKGLDRIRKMVANPSLAALLPVLDRATAAALHVDSYVSSNRLPVRSIDCYRDHAQEAMDNFIVGVFSGDAGMIDRTMSDQSRRTLRHSELLLRPYDQVRRYIPAPRGVGYTLSPTTQEPEDTSALLTGTAATAQDGTQWFLITFTDSNGGVCLKRRIRFSRSEGAAPLLVDEPFVPDLILTAAFCSIVVVK